MTTPTSSHIFFIPGMILIGMFLGFILGARAARNQMDLQKRRDADRDIARAARAAKRGVAVAAPVVEVEAEADAEAEAEAEADSEAAAPEPAEAKPAPGKKKAGKRR
ncbi:MAG: hypothetical protein ABI867_08815 [Kofleriaceae bacterium]